MPEPNFIVNPKRSHTLHKEGTPIRYSEGQKFYADPQKVKFAIKAATIRRIEPEDNEPEMESDTEIDAEIEVEMEDEQEETPKNAPGIGFG